jgi:hypothetical protein
MSKNKILFLSISLLLCSIIKAEIDFPKIRGWNKADSAKLFDSETLWEYIDGAAESYLNYNFRQLEVMEYSRSQYEYIKVEVYHQGSDIDAFGIYAFERPMEAEFLELGCEGYMVHSSLNFYTEDCYIKIQSHQTDEKTLSAIRTIAEKVAVVISEEPDKPILLDLLPDYEKIPRSEKYFSSNFLGYSFLNNVIAADYLSNGQEYKMFVLISDSKETALNTLQRYFKQTKTDTKPVMDKLCSVDDLFNGYVALTVLDRFLLGIIDMSDRELANEYLSEFADFVRQSSQ